MNNFAYAGIFAALAVVSLIVFLFNMRAFKRFKVLDSLSKALAVIVTCVSLGAVGAFSWFSFENLTYKPPKQDELTRQLQEQIKEVKQTKSKYSQIISSKDYLNASIDDLYNHYTKSGKQDIDNLAKDSELTKNLFLRNVGRQYKKSDVFTTKVKTTNGKEVDLEDGKNRVLLFVDTTEYSSKLIQTLRSYIKKNKSDVELVLVFPLASGTEIDEFFNKNLDYLGLQNESLIVSNDSLANLLNTDAKAFAVDEYHVENLPSYIAIDSDSIISNAGVGSLLESEDDVASWFNKAFTSETKYYSEIVDTPAGETSTSKTNKEGE